MAAGPGVSGFGYENQKFPLYIVNDWTKGETDWSLYDSSHITHITLFQSSLAFDTSEIQ
jgi:hypothetical protein